MMTKACTNCDEMKPLSEFHNNSRGRHGKAGRCKECAVRMARERRQAHRAPEAVRCKHDDCPKEGHVLPEGYGFRFCAEHESTARQVLDKPKEGTE